MAKLTDNQKSLIIFGGGILLSIGAGVMIYLDLKETGVVEAEIATAEDEKAKNQKIIDKIPGLKKELVAFKKMVADNAKILPTADDLNNFVRDLSTLEKEAGVSYRTLPPYKQEQYRQVASITRIPMKLQLTASTRAFLRFLNQFESRERLISVSDFRINPTMGDPKPGEGEVQHDIGISFELYRYDPKAGPGGEFPVKGDEELQLLESKDVKDIIAKQGKPASIEKWTLIPGRENRRDIFADPRRRVGGKESDKGKDDQRVREEAVLDTLRLKLEKARLDGEAYRSAEQAKDFLRMAAAKRTFNKSRSELEEGIREVSQNNPEFKSRDLQDLYIVEVRRPYEKLMTDFADIIGKGPEERTRITEVMARGFHKDLRDLMDARRFTEASEKWNGISALIREAGNNVEAGAQPVIEEMGRLGTHAVYQAELAAKRMEVTGIVRMGKGAAVVVSLGGQPAKIVFQDKNVDRDLVFLRVEEGPRGKGDRIVFKLSGHEVDHIQQKQDPQAEAAERPVLTQD